MPESSLEILRQYNLSLDEAAEVLRVSRKTMTRWRQRKYGPKPIQYGKIWLYSMIEIEKWLKQLTEAQA